MYFDPIMLQALRLKAADTQSSLSALVGEAVRLMISDDKEDLKLALSRGNEPEISYEALRENLKKHRKL